jgi:PAS domain-containing protein
LRALGLLDTDAEERFDRITRLAQTLFDVPIALITLVDSDRQWFKSSQGLEAKETSRGESFCGHAILGKEILEVPDAAADERFRDNPLVTGTPKIRFYAGAPLAGPDGRIVGTLCLIDREPRSLSERQKRALRELAAFVERELADGVPAAPAPSSSDPAAERRRVRRDRIIAGFFAVALTLILSAAAVSYRGVRGLVDAVHRVSRAHAVLSELEEAHEEHGKAREARLAELRVLLARDPEQLRRLDAAQRLEGGAAEDAFDDALDALGAPERRLLAESSVGFESDARALVVVASFARLVGALVLILAFLTTRRFLKERGAAEAALVSARDEVVRDANARRRAHEENRRLGDRLRAVLDQLDSGVMLVEPNGTIALFNLAAERIFGAWRGEIERLLKGGTHPTLRPDGKTPYSPEAEPAARALKGETVRGEAAFLRTPFRPQGCPVVLSAAPMRSSQGLVTGAIVIIRETGPV